MTDCVFSIFFLGFAHANGHLRPKFWNENDRKNMNNFLIHKLEETLIFDQKNLEVECTFFVFNLMNVFPMFVSNLHITDLVLFSLVLAVWFRSYSVFLVVVFHQKIIFSKTKITGPRWFHFWKSKLLSKKSHIDPDFFSCR